MKEVEIKDEYITEVLNHALELKVKKMHDYGVDIGIHKYGLKGIVHDIARKFGRMENLILEGKSLNISDESLYDTFIDLINYSIDGAYFTRPNKENHGE